MVLRFILAAALVVAVLPSYAATGGLGQDEIPVMSTDASLNNLHNLPASAPTEFGNLKSLVRRADDRTTNPYGSDDYGSNNAAFTSTSSSDSDELSKQLYAAVETPSSHGATWRQDHTKPVHPEILRRVRTQLLATMKARVDRAVLSALDYSDQVEGPAALRLSQMLRRHLGGRYGWSLMQPGLLRGDERLRDRRYRHVWIKMHRDHAPRLDELDGEAQQVHNGILNLARLYRLASSTQVAYARAKPREATPTAKTHFNPTNDNHHEDADFAISPGEKQIYRGIKTRWTWLRRRLRHLRAAARAQSYWRHSRSGPDNRASWRAAMVGPVKARLENWTDPFPTRDGYDHQLDFAPLPPEYPGEDGFWALPFLERQEALRGGHQFLSGAPANAVPRADAVQHGKSEGSDKSKGK